jgi:hypothetical protein
MINMTFPLLNSKIAILPPLLTPTICTYPIFISILLTPPHNLHSMSTYHLITRLFVHSWTITHKVFIYLKTSLYRTIQHNLTLYLLNTSQYTNWFWLHSNLISIWNKSPIYTTIHTNRHYSLSTFIRNTLFSHHSSFSQERPFLI